MWTASISIPEAVTCSYVSTTSGVTAYVRVLSLTGNHCVEVTRLISCCAQGQVLPLELTPDHLIYFEDLQLSLEGTRSLSALPQKPARALAVNDVIFVVIASSTAVISEPTGRLQRARVTRIEVARRREGALTLYTMTGSLVVDGAVCSNFGDYYPRLPGRLARRRDLVAFLLFAPHRALFSLLPLEATADALRLVMDALVLPALRTLRGCP
jgi:hypothetical protein